MIYILHYTLKEESANEYIVLVERDERPDDDCVCEFEREGYELDDWYEFDPSGHSLPLETILIPDK